MFKIFKRTEEALMLSELAHADAEYAHTKLKALEDYLNIEFFHGAKSKPHYRKKKVIIKKLGRPRKIK